jgi:hypothetical protein
MRQLAHLAVTLTALCFLASCSYVGADGQATLPTTQTASAPYDPNFEILESSMEASEARVVACFDLPSDMDWVLGRLPGDVRLSDGAQTASMTSFTSFSLWPASAGTPARRCDALLFPLPLQFDSSEDVLTIERIAASLPADPDWDLLFERLRQVAPGIVIEPLEDASGLSFALIDKPPGMSDLEAHNIVVGIAEPVEIGPWEIPIEFGGS